MYVKKLKAFSKWPQSFLGLMSLSLFTFFLFFNMHKEPVRIIALNLPNSAISPDDNLNVYERPDIPDYEYKIRPGNSLSQIFSTLDIPYRDLLRIMEADLNHLRIDTLQPNDVLHIWMDKKGKHLERLELEFSITSKVKYIRLEDGSYHIEEFSIPGDWIKTIIRGEIKGTFSESASFAGLSYNEIESVTRLLKDKINFNRDLRVGDKFDLVRIDQYVEGIPSGENEIQAVRIESRGRYISAYLHDDGNYYDKNGESLQRAFQRYPTIKKYRISSHFKPKRKHPVTGRLRPHNGTDFAVNIGTPVVTTGDGVVLLVKDHPYAGKYLVIAHNKHLKTRYLHNSKIVVREGQRVRRGQLIALSGKTGRVTGPHIHYEMLMRDRPVDPMKAYIPMINEVPKEEMVQFVQSSAAYDVLMNREESSNPV